MSINISPRKLGSVTDKDPDAHPGHFHPHCNILPTKDITPAAHHHIPKQTRQGRGQGADFDPEVCVGVDLRICCDPQACL